MIFSVSKSIAMFQCIKLFDSCMSSKRGKGEQEIKVQEPENIKEYWTEHRTTLIAFEAQYIYNKKTDVEEQDSQPKNSHKRKKDLTYENSFLFSGRGEQKGQCVVNMIKQSNKHTALQDLFNDAVNHSEDMLELREFIKIMLQLKHSTLVKEFMDIYEFIVKQIRDIKFDQVRVEEDRKSLIKHISQRLTSYVTSLGHNFKTLAGYLKEDKAETVRLFTVTIYCFIAERFNFNINEYYCEAFDLEDIENKKPKKKRKMEKEEKNP